MSRGRQIVVCDGDETGQELLVEALRVLAPDVLGFDLELVHFDLSLENRRATANAVVREAAAAMRDTGLGLKAATVTPETRVTSGARTASCGRASADRSSSGRAAGSPGVPPPAPVVHPIVVVRMAVGDAYGAEERRTGTRAASTNRRGGPSASTARCAGPSPSTRSARRRRSGRASTAAPSGPSRRSTRACSRRRWTTAAARYPDIPYRPTLIDAAYAGLLTESSEQPTRHPGPQPRR